jgi:hypothetical protein
MNIENLVLYSNAILFRTLEYWNIVLLKNSHLNLSKATKNLISIIFLNYSILLRFNKFER